MEVNLSPLEAMIVAINKKDLEEFIKNDYNKMRG